MPSDWLPIETAPKAGEIMVYGGTWSSEISDKSPAGQDANIVSWDEGLLRFERDGWAIKGTSGYYALVVKPTHWKPLPEPPDAK